MYFLTAVMGHVKLPLLLTLITLLKDQFLNHPLKEQLALE